ncbi:SDR family oxidoreductase [Brachybacterium sp. YJGR34]|uniref:SDR family oxidoreductase n=1 Tax=Brachybacterium sp. YJGR34 TaxID=2059911 RepID=UPI000E09F457|nr:SDR family oxidoreductase [Brachybacterium sp. YJGR34]
MSRTVVVTGAASGIGRATAEQLEAAGDTVLRVDLREGDVTGDLGDPESVDRVAAEIAERTGGVLDGLVANAGVSVPGELSVKINYLGTVRLVEALRPLLAAAGSPRVSITSSAATLQASDPELVDLLLAGEAEAAIARGAALAAQGPATGYANYSSSKRAISRWVRRVAPTPEYAGAGIGINAVGPGQVRTGMTEDLLASEAGRQQAADAMPTPYNGIADAEHIAAVHVFLVSAANARMTGQVLFADGGFDALRRGDDIWQSV